MRYKHLLSEEQLDELRMNPSSLRQFVDSPEAEGIQAGFEAELVFTGLGGEPEYDEDPEPDYDADERCRTLDGVIEFFQNDEWGYGLSDRQASRLRDDLDEKYYEWYDEQLFAQWQDERDELIKDHFLDEQPWIERVHAVLVDGMELSDEEADKIIKFGEARKNGTLGKPGSEYTEEELDMLSTYNEAVSDADAILDEEVESCISSEDKIYDSVLDDFRDNFYIDDDSGFFSDVGLRWMSDVANEYDLSWPVITYTGGGGEGGFSEENARNLADSLAKELGVDTYVSGGYHSATRKPGRWIFEPDSSLDADDSDNMPVEIVSPPMPLKECLRQLENFFAWAESNGAYTNSSTGFHMGVSLPHRGGTVDYIKLALFLGDEYVLDEFGRAANHFCEAAMKKIKKKLGASHNQEQVGNALDLMRHNLLELATKALKIVGPEGFGKYTSINPKGNYIEFRSAGGSHYMEDIDRLKNMLMRYAKAMHVAAEPALERKEYYKKLYKLIAPRTGDASLDLFSRFATGSITKEELKKSWAEVALQKDAPSLVGKGDWVVVNTATGKPVQGQTYNGYTRDEARSRAKQSLSPASSDTDFDLSYELQPQNTGKWEVYKKNDDGSEETLEIVDAERKGEAVDKVYDKYNDQNIAFNVRSYHGEKQPEPKLSRRAELAKRIRAPKPDWNVVYRPTGRVIDTIMNVSREEAQKLLVKVAQQHQFDSVDDLELHNKADTDKAEAGKDGDWNLINRHTKEVVNHWVHMTNQEAAQMALRWLRDHQFNTSDFQIVPREEQRYSSYADAQRAADQQNQSSQQEVDGTGEPVWQIYGTNTGRTVEEFSAEDHDAAAEHLRGFLNELGPDDSRELYALRPKMQEAQPDVAQNFSPDLNWRDELRRHIEPSLNPNPTTHDDNQVRMPNGMPVWEVFDRETGSVINQLADHTQREAHSRMLAWLDSIGAEDPASYDTRFGVRAKMLQPGERNLSPTIRESRAAKRVFAEFDDYFESVITPAKKRLK
jgi:hypothetical protein